ncbi:MAG: LptF/LptG family permease [Bacteroidales bacterium]|nr:LptF/LptG family permease [Bacteroidales bacterium]MBQ1707833.1 LptF/LptG family permease [Bacteroidales bacterium]MBQ4012342.1 LptF/LptG family permease [Bacteroidales bacterium]
MQTPHVKILDRYIIRKFLGTFLFIILIAVLIVVIFDLSEKIDKFLTKQIPLKEIVFDYYAGFIPWIVNSFSPLFVFISAIFFTSKLAQNSEIVAMLAGGISFRRLMAPYMFSAGVIALLSLMLGLYVIPPANKHRLDFENKYIKTQAIAADNMRNIHYQIAPGEFVYVEQFSRWANTAYRFTLEHIEDHKIVSKISAESAAWDSTRGGWTLKNYFIRDFYGESEMVRTGRQLDTVINLTLEDFYRRQNAVESMSGRDLNDLIEVQRLRGDALIKRSLIEKNSRIAMPFSAFVLTVIAVSLSSRKKRGGLGLNIGIGLALSFSYILFMKFSQMFVTKGIIASPALALWIPNILFAIVAVILYKLAPK